mmetsp:Transcript_115484/g.361221  ORF Transcript_115484/g.361221 Transcript_115484/m.361221 type:complete len:265 (-) Transcript_115484:306-1100(-)
MGRLQRAKLVGSPGMGSGVLLVGMLQGLQLPVLGLGPVAEALPRRGVEGLRSLQGVHVVGVPAVDLDMRRQGFTESLQLVHLLIVCRADGRHVLRMPAVQLAQHVLHMAHTILQGRVMFVRLFQRVHLQGVFGAGRGLLVVGCLQCLQRPRVPVCGVTQGSLQVVQSLLHRGVVLPSLCSSLSVRVQSGGVLSLHSLQRPHLLRTCVRRAAQRHLEVVDPLLQQCVLREGSLHRLGVRCHVRGVPCVRSTQLPEVLSVPVRSSA